MTSQVYIWPWRLSWTAVNLLTLHTFNKSCYLLGSSFIHFGICEWNDSYGIMLLSTCVSWRYKHFETNRFNRKKLHVPPRTVGITAYYVQYIIHTELCRVCWLLVRVTEWAIVTMVQAARYRFRTPVETCDFSLLWNVQTGCGTTQPLIQRVCGFFPWGKVARVWSWPLFSIWWPRLGVSGAVPLLPHYAFMAWIRQLSLIQDSTVEGCNKPCL